MCIPEHLTQLIDRASKVAGSDSKLARKLDVATPTVNQWRNGKPCPVADQALMAEIAGLVPEEWLARAVIARYEGTVKGEMLQKALKKWLPAIGAAIASNGANAAELIKQFVQCINCQYKTKNPA